MADDCDEGQSGDFDMDLVCINSLQMNSTREVLAALTFHSEGQTHPHEGKVDTGAMASCIPVSMLFSIGIRKSSLKPSRAILKGISGMNLKNQGTVTVHVSCNSKLEATDFYVAEYGCEIILGLPFCKQFQLVLMADVCYQRQVSCSMQAVHTTEESSIDNGSIKKKWSRHFPLGKMTGSAMKDLQGIFPSMFDGSVELFEDFPIHV
jgi:hypothetical protein